MVLDDCDVCMEYWVSNGTNMEGYRYLASNRHIPMVHHPAENNISMQTQPPVQDSSIPQYPHPAAPMPKYLHSDVLVPPPPRAPKTAAWASDSSMLSQPYQSHNITIPEDPAMPTPPDQTSMPPAMMMTSSQNHHTSTPTSSVDSEEITDPLILSQPDPSHTITIPEYPHMTNRPDQTYMPPARKRKAAKKKRMTSQNDHTTTIPVFGDWGETIDVLVPPPTPTDTSMLRDQSNNITTPEDPAMPTPPDQTSMPPAMMGTWLNDGSTSTTTSSVDSEEIAATYLSILSQPDSSHTITKWEYAHMTNRPDPTSMLPARKNKRMTLQNDHPSTIPTFDGWGETTDSILKPSMEISEDEGLIMSPIWLKTQCESLDCELELVRGDNLQGRHANPSPQETHKMRCLQLYKAATTGDWKSANIILCAHEVLKTAKIRRDSETALHVAVGCGPRTIKFVEDLLNILTPSDLELTNMDGHTALGIAAKVGNLEAAKLLVIKNPNLPNISSEGYPAFPIHCAAIYGHKKLLLYLLEVTTNKAYLNPDDDDNGKKFFADIMKAEFYDVARMVIERDRRVSIWGASKGLNLLAENPSSFSFGRDTKFLKRFVEKCVPDSIIQEDSNTTWKIKLYHSLWKLCGKLVPPLNHMVERLLKYRHAVKLVSSFCIGESNFLEGSTSTTKSFVLKFKMPMQLAADNGIHEIIEEVTKKGPDAMWFFEEHNNCDIFKLAIINRHPKVYNLLYELGDLYINTVRHSVDEEGNTMLHLAADLAPPQRLNLISGAASQMQHEVQWYKEIENLVPLPFRNLPNRIGKTPRDVFLDSHQQLMAKAEKWMKGTANSCTVSAALITTIVFAAAITVPGGNSGENGIPMFARNTAFIIFGVADALSLFTSSISILMFLSILTSRYAEHDFLYALPRRLIIGLLALFVSIASMMAAFSATLYLVFGAHKLGILISVIVSAFIPVAIFALLQFSLLSEMISSTYGLGMFRSRKSSFSTDRREDEFQRLDKAIEDYDTEDVRLKMP